MLFKIKAGDLNFQRRLKYKLSYFGYVISDNILISVLNKEKLEKEIFGLTDWFLILELGERNNNILSNFIFHSALERINAIRNKTNDKNKYRNKSKIRYVLDSVENAIGKEERIELERVIGFRK
ncbi:MAG: hypothetical protein ACPLYF_03665 [Fervidobacterium sp.]